MKVVAVIPARGGSKGIPKKNIVNICNKPLISWSIMQAKATSGIDSVWVSSDSEEILEVAQSFGSSVICRPDNISGDNASSESAWLHALEFIESAGIQVDVMIGMQATSPIRETKDLNLALELFYKNGLDSLLSCVEIEDFFMWKYSENNSLVGINHDYRNRRRRQLIEKRYLENGSFYIFKSDIIRKEHNRLGGKIGMYVMEKYKMFQIDTYEDITLCESIMRGYGLDR